MLSELESLIIFFVLSHFATVLVLKTNPSKRLQDLSPDVTRLISSYLSLKSYTNLASTNRHFGMLGTYAGNNYSEIQQEVYWLYELHHPKLLSITKSRSLYNSKLDTILTSITRLNKSLARLSMIVLARNSFTQLAESYIKSGQLSKKQTTKLHTKSAAYGNCEMLEMLSKYSAPNQSVIQLNQSLNRKLINEFCHRFHCSPVSLNCIRSQAISV